MFKKAFIFIKIPQHCTNLDFEFKDFKKLILLFLVLSLTFLFSWFLTFKTLTLLLCYSVFIHHIFHVNFYITRMLWLDLYRYRAMVQPTVKMNCGRMKLKTKWKCPKYVYLL